MKAGRKKRMYPKRKDIIKVPSNYYELKEEDIVEQEYDATAEEDNEEEVDEVDEVLEDEQVDEYVPTEGEMRTELEETVFGGNFAQVLVEFIKGKFLKSGKFHFLKKLKFFMKLDQF